MNTREAFKTSNIREKYFKICKYIVRVFDFSIWVLSVCFVKEYLSILCILDLDKKKLFLRM